MNTNMTGYRWFSKFVCPCVLDESGLKIGRVKIYYCCRVNCPRELPLHLECQHALTTLKGEVYSNKNITYQSYLLFIVLFTKSYKHATILILSIAISTHSRYDKRR